MDMCKPRFGYTGSWCEESRAQFASLKGKQTGRIIKTGGIVREKGSTDCITRDNDTQGG